MLPFLRALGPTALCLSLVTLAPLPGMGIGTRVAMAQSSGGAQAQKASLLRAARRGASGVNELLRVIQDLQWEVEPERLHKLLRELAQDRRVIAPLRDWVSYQATLLEERSGRITPAQADLRYKELGYLTQVQVLGPFADGSLRSLEQPLAPELKTASPDKGYMGKVRGQTLVWRDASVLALRAGAYIALDDILYPNTDALAYLRTFVRVPGQKGKHKVSLSLGSGGQYRVWVNGELQGQGGADRRPHPLQDEVSLELSPGWNELLIKGNVQEGLWGYYLRLTDLAGQEIRGLEQRASAPGPEGEQAGRSKALPKKGEGGLRSRLEKAAKKKRVQDLAALFDFYRYTDPFDRNDPTLEELAQGIDEKRPSAHSAFTWAQVTRGEGPKGERLALALERKNRKRDPESTAQTHARAHAQIALRRQELEQNRAHQRHLNQAAALWPDHTGIALIKIRDLQRKGWDKVALLELKQLAQRHPASSMVRTALARALAGQGEHKAAFAELESLQKLYGKSSGASRLLIELLLEHGDQQAALELARTALMTRDRPGQMVELARLEEASENQMRAIALMDKALEVSPFHDGFHRERAEMLLRAGQRSAAIAGFERSLDLRPQQPDLRDLLAALGAENASDLYQEESLRLDGIEKKIAKAKADYPGADAVMLDRKQIVRVLSNGLRESLDHRQIYIADLRGAKAQESQGTVYDPEQSFVQVKRARVRHADGSIEELGNAETFSLTAAGYRMFYDQRQLVVKFPGLRPGDVIDLAFMRRDIADENYFGDYFGDLRPLRQEMAQLGGEIVYQAPKTRKLFFNRPVKKSEAGKSWRYSIRAPKGGPLRSQPNMPGWTDAIDFVHVSSYEQWDAVANWYWELVREQLVSDDAIKGAVDEILAKLGPSASTEQKVAALYEHVVQKTRYVGLEFGIHGYKPYRTTQIYERRFGDCKDKASLLKVMLELAGIESYLVLVRTKDQGRLTQSPASLSAFNHAILYVPSLKRFLDGTAEFSGYGELPSADHGASVLIVKDGKGGDFLRIPAETPKDNQLDEAFELYLASDGSAKAKIRLQAQGNLMSSYRRAFEDPTTQAQSLQRQLSQRFSGVKVKLATPISTSLDQGLDLSADLEIPRIAEKDDAKTRSFPVLGKESQLAAGRTGTSKRRHRFARRSPVKLIRSFVYHLPKGKTFSALPKPTRIQSPFGEFELQVQADDSMLVLNMRLRLESGVLSVKDFYKYREFLRSIDQALNQRVRFGI